MLHHSPAVQGLIEEALREDLGLGDPTTDALVPPHLRGRGVLVVKASGVIAGVEVAMAVFRRIDPLLQTTALLEDGARVSPGTAVAQVEGPVASILKGERTALNFLQRLSGIATGAAQYAEAIKGTKALIIDTRKTTPGLRALEKYAVRVGRAHNHRYNLGDGVLIKDNHIVALKLQGLSLAEGIARARRFASHTIKIEVEVESLEQAREALEGDADILMLDNMSLEAMREVVRLVKGRALTEASGGITLERVRAVAETGVDLISVGALTHSVKALDISLDLEYAPEER